MSYLDIKKKLYQSHDKIEFLVAHGTLSSRKESTTIKVGGKENKVNYSVFLYHSSELNLSHSSYGRIETLHQFVNSIIEQPLVYAMLQDYMETKSNKYIKSIK